MPPFPPSPSAAPSPDAHAGEPHGPPPHLLPLLLLLHPVTSPPPSSPARGSSGDAYPPSSSAHSYPLPSLEPKPHVVAGATSAHPRHVVLAGARATSSESPCQNCRSRTAVSTRPAGSPPPPLGPDGQAETRERQELVEESWSKTCGSHLIF